MDDPVGYHFALLASPDFAIEIGSETRAALERLRVVVVSADGDADAYLVRAGARAIVLRPDRHILGIASTVDELDSILARVPTLAHISETPRAAANFQ